MKNWLFVTSLILMSLAIGTPAMTQSGGFDYQTEVKEIYSKNLNELHKLNIYLPQGYSNGAMKYPVLYVLESIYHFLNGVKSTHSLSHLTGQIPNMIIVGLNTKDRWMDLTPVKTEEWYGYPLPNSGNGQNYLDFIAQEVVPFIDSTYQTQPFRIFYGHSLGGLFTLFSLTTYPDLFSGYIASSPNLTYGDSIIIKSASKLKPAMTHKYIYLCGDSDYEGYTDEIQIFRDQIDQDTSIESHYNDYKDETHLSTPDRSMSDGLTYIFKDYSLNDSIVEGGASAIKSYFEKASELYGYDIKPAGGYINYLASNELSVGKINKAIEIFEYNASLYPEEEYIIENLANAYLKQGNKSLALSHYESILELNPDHPVAKDIIKEIKQSIIKH